MSWDEPTQEEYEDAVIEDTVHCVRCGTSYVLPDGYLFGGRSVCVECTQDEINDLLGDPPTGDWFATIVVAPDNLDWYASLLEGGHDISRGYGTVAAGVFPSTLRAYAEACRKAKLYILGKGGEQ